MQASRDIARLIEIMAALRTPGTGCAWDLIQSFQSILPYTVEEAFEVADAIERGDRADLRDELGDLLLQVAFHARMAEEEGSFDFGDVVEAITAKLIRRHPHVFGDARELPPDAVEVLWGKIKAQEKSDRAARTPPGQSSCLLDDVPAAFPPLLRATKLQVRAATVGFDWADPRMVLAKVREELDEVAEALETDDHAALEDEIGDLLFSVVNLARHTAVDPDRALRGTNGKFQRRFGFVEASLSRQGVSLAEASLEQMETLWAEAKRREN